MTKVHDESFEALINNWLPISNVEANQKKPESQALVELRKRLQEYANAKNVGQRQCGVHEKVIHDFEQAHSWDVLQSSIPDFMKMISEDLGLCALSPLELVCIDTSSTILIDCGQIHSDKQIRQQVKQNIEGHAQDANEAADVEAVVEAEAQAGAAQVAAKPKAQKKKGKQRVEPPPPLPLPPPPPPEAELESGTEEDIVPPPLSAASSPHRPQASPAAASPATQKKEAIVSPAKAAASPAAKATPKQKVAVVEKVAVVAKRSRKAVRCIACSFNAFEFISPPAASRRHRRRQRESERQRCRRGVLVACQLENSQDQSRTEVKCLIQLC